MKKQIVVIHGGETFRSYKEYMDYLKAMMVDLGRLKTKRWKENLQDDLGQDFQVICPKMPNPLNAKYKEWKIMFEKFFPFLKNNVLLLGHSLGGIFLAKYLSENDFPKRIKAVFLISAPFDDKKSDYSLADFKLPKNLQRFQKQAGKIFLYHSKDDKVVRFSDFKKYKNELSGAKTLELKNRGHFDQKKIPELLKDIKSLS
jgi:predicted alpha/beta hydrolase family esterase